MLETTKTWIEVCKLSDLPANKAADLHIANQRLIIARSGDNAHIYQGFCTHMLFPLAGSKIDECNYTCPVLSFLLEPGVQKSGEWNDRKRWAFNRGIRPSKS